MQITEYGDEWFRPTQPYHVRVFINGQNAVWPPLQPDKTSRAAADELARRLREEYPGALVRVDATRYII